MSSVVTQPKMTLQDKISQMRLTLAPIFPVPDGPPHSAFPKTVLQYWLLTEDQLDEFARYYHQTSPTDRRQACYRQTMNWDRDFLARPDPLHMSKEQQDACMPVAERLSIKRRKFGKFIGLRGCETPIEEVQKRIEFLQERMEQNIRVERQLMTRKWNTPFDL